ncbi:MAG: small ribosomal subunit Rsm22 family protein [Bacteriovoracia bacterium]
MFFLRESFRFPPDLEEALTRALWQGIPTPQAIAKRSAGLKSLWPRLAKGRGIVPEHETHYSFRREEAEAYAAYYLPANALKVAVVLEEAFLLGQDPLPQEEAQWLDVGTGPGTAFWGAAWWCAQRSKKFSFHGWDQSPLFSEIAANLTRAKPFGFTARFQAPAAKGENWESLLRKNKPTHLSFVNSLAEVYPDFGARKKAMANALNALRAFSEADGKERFLVLIEPGSRESSRELAELKDALQSEGLGRVLLPCLDARPCGALKEARDWCHEEASCEFPEWVNEVGASVGLRKEALLFSYVLISATASPSPPRSTGRIVSQRMERKGQVECRICLPDGKRAARVQRSKAHAENEFVLECARGDLWDNVELEEKGDVKRATLLRAKSSSVFPK